MTREEIEKEHRVVGSTIVAGKFEGCPVYAPEFWRLGQDGAADKIDHDGAFTFQIDASDVDRWAELEGVTSIVLWADSDGTVVTFVRRAR